MVKAQSQTFALIVTAEPYYAVRIPSELVDLNERDTQKYQGQNLPRQQLQAYETQRVLQAGKSTGAEAGFEEGAARDVRSAKCCGDREVAGSQPVCPGSFLEGTI